MTDVEQIENLLCHVDIATGWTSYEDEVELIIWFRDGPLAGKDYKIVKNGNKILYMVSMEITKETSILGIYESIG